MVIVECFEGEGSCGGSSGSWQFNYVCWQAQKGRRLADLQVSEFLSLNGIENGVPGPREHLVYRDWPIGGNKSTKPTPPYLCM